MSTIMLIALVVVFALIFAMRRSRGPHVLEITRPVTREKGKRGDA